VRTQELAMKHLAQNHVVYRCKSKLTYMRMVSAYEDEAVVSIHELAMRHLAQNHVEKDV
jgi:hypothetical protein